MDSGPTRKHILLVTIPAFGHLIPLLELGRKLVKFHDVTLAVSSQTIAQANERELLLDDGIQYLPIEDGVDLNVPMDPTVVSSFLQLMDKVGGGITRLATSLPTRKPDGTFDKASSGIRGADAVIIDNFVAKFAISCVDKGIQFYHFAPASAGSLMAFVMVEESWPVIPEGEHMPMMTEPKPGAPPAPMPEIFKRLLLDIQSSIPKLTGIIVNTVAEVEGPIMSVIKTHPKMARTDVFAVGPLMGVEKEDPKTFAMKGQIANWLDSKKDRSVVYVSFGSVAWPSVEQIGELIRGLQALNQPFVLALRKMFQDGLPDDIKQGMTGQFATNSNCLVVDWAPQKFILGHPATAVFISHCGWNSTLEAMAAGIPVVGWPMFADQKVNAQFAAKRGLGVVVEGTGSRPDRVIPAQEVEETVRKVGGFDSQKSSYWAAAQDVKNTIRKAIVPGGSSHTDVMRLAKASVGQDARKPAQ